jgi:hypothetical protein
VIEAYPLRWPEGWPRTKWPRRSRYDLSFARARDEIVRQVRLAKGRETIITTNVPLRRDGLPLANMSEPKDSGVAVYWDDKDRKPRVIAIDAWATVRENMRAVAMAVESLRAFDRTGAKAVIDRVYDGFARLPEQTADCWSILGLQRGATRDAISERYRALAREHHPDRGGNAETMARINAAYHEATR